MKANELIVTINPQNDEINISSSKFPVELHEEIRKACEKYYKKYHPAK